MMKYLLHFCLLVLCSTALVAQPNSLFDDSKVGKIYIYFPEDSLKKLYIDIFSDHYFNAQFVFDNGIKQDTIKEIGFRLRGNTSRAAKKKSFKISFNEFVQGQKYQGVKKLNLVGAHNDPTMVREKIFYDTWNKAGMPKRRSAFVRVYINDEYYGLYTNLEEIDKDWLKLAFNNNNGNLYKCTYPADLVYIDANPDSYKTLGGDKRVYELQTNKTEDNYSDLSQLIALLDQTPDAAFVSNIQTLLNVSGTLKAFALEVAMGHWDDYAYNKNNYYLYHNSVTGKFEFISYDADNTLGVDWIGRDWAQRSCFNWLASGKPRPLISKLLTVPQFREIYKSHLTYISEQLIHPDTIFPRIDAIKTLVEDAAFEDTYHTLDYGYTYASFVDGFTKKIDGHTPYGIKPFLALRQKTMKEQVLLDVAQLEKEYNKLPFTLSPNPTKEMLTITFKKEKSKLLNGKIVDTLGRIHLSFEMEASENSKQLNIETLPKGMYWLILDGGKGRSFMKE